MSSYQTNVLLDKSSPEVCCCLRQSNIVCPSVSNVKDCEQHCKEDRHPPPSPVQSHLLWKTANSVRKPLHIISLPVSSTLKVIRWRDILQKNIAENKTHRSWDVLSHHLHKTVPTRRVAMLLLLLKMWPIYQCLNSLDGVASCVFPHVFCAPGPS